MEILELHLKHFGKFTDYRLELHSGVNIISGGNEAGKTTLHAFIRAMLYGIPRSRSKSQDEYQLREPWENPAYFAGAMRVLYEDRIYRIERNFHRRDERLNVVCETDGTQVQDPEGALALFTGGLSEADFVNTLFIRQAQPAADASLGVRLRDYMVNLEQSNDAGMDVGAAQDFLKKKRKEVEAQKAEAMSGIEEEIRQKTQEKEYLEKDIERLLVRKNEASVIQGSKASFERVRREDESKGDRGSDTARDGGIRGSDTSLDEGDRGSDFAGRKEIQGFGTIADARMRETEAPAGERPGTAQEERLLSFKGESGPEKGHELPEYAAEETEEEERGGLLLPALTFLAFVCAGVMTACAFLTGEYPMRYVMAAGGIVCAVIAVVLLWRILHPVSKAERLRRRVKRGEFLDRHLGFREDPEDPADLAQMERRERRRQEAMLRAQEEEQAELQAQEDRRRKLISMTLEQQAQEDRRRRAQEVREIARRQEEKAFQENVRRQEEKASPENAGGQEEKASQENAGRQETKEFRESAAGTERKNLREVAQPIQSDGGGDGLRPGSDGPGTVTASSKMQAKAQEDERIRASARGEVLDREIRIRSARRDELTSAIEELYSKKAALGSFDEELMAISMASDRIKDLSGKIYHESGAQFSEDVSVLLAGLTEGRYTRISLDEKMQIRISTPDRLLTVDQVSCGTMHQIYFALRLASAHLLTGEEDLPVILDEPFAMYDDERLESALRYLSGSARQVILFSCHRRELDTLARIRA